MGEWDWQAWLTVGVALAAFASLVRGMPTDAVMLGAAVILGVAGVINLEEMFSGFSNPGVLTVASLFVVSAALRETGALDRIGQLMLGRVRTERKALMALAPQVVALSAFLNNTAVVAMLTKIVGDWCRKNHVSPSRLLLPLSYLAILGGMCTLIGTSTNLLVNGLIIDEAARRPDTVGLHPFSLFELGKLGLPCVIIGVAYLRLMGRRLLPDRKDLLEQFDANSRHYLVNLRIEPQCPLIGKQIEEAGLRRLPGLFLIEIVREGRVIAPVEPDETLLADDHLTFTGAVSTIVDLERIPGLVPAEHDDVDRDPTAARYRRYCEAVVSGSSPLLERTIRSANFRARYNAAVVAVHRGGVRLTGRVGDIMLRPGDTLLLQTGPHFAEAHRNDPGFFLVSSIDEARPVRHNRAYAALGLLAALIILMAFNVTPPVLAAGLVAMAMVGTRCISVSDARRTLPWDVLLTIAAAFALGHALEKTGVASSIAHQLVQAAGAWGPTAVLAVVYLVTMLCTETITNNAAAVLMFPFALAAADQLGVNPRPFAVAVAFAASASFATPIGYQTNMIVFGPGGYRFNDFLRVGVPLSLLMWIAAVVGIPMLWPF